MIYTLISILGIFLTIFFVVGTHESAHFFMARWMGIKVLRFSIGFGKTLLRWTDKKGTEYVLALIPLGGYVKMLDESEGKVAPEELHLAYNRQPFYKKFLVVLAGPVTNILCALVLYWLIFMIGFTTIKPVIGNIEPHSIAAQSGMKGNQEIIAVDNSTTSTWTGIMLRLIAHAGDQDHVKIETRDLTSNQTNTFILDLADWHLDKLTPDPLSSLGIAPYEPTIPLVIGIVNKDSPAAASPLKIGDKIIAINSMSMNNWNDVLTTIRKHPAETLTFYVERNKQFMQIPVAIGYQRGITMQQTGYLGLGPDFKLPPELLKDVKYNPLDAAGHAWKEIIDFSYFNLLLFGKMVTGKISLQSMGGPITIFETAGDALNTGLLSFLGFLAFLSIAIGVVNLLPIPGLDGGHMFIQIVEFIIQRPVPEEVLTYLYRFGFLLIFFVLIQAVINDVMRLY